MSTWNQRRKIHSSWLIASAATGVVGGVAASPGLGVSGVHPSWPWFVPALMVTVFVWRTRYALLLALTAGTLAGFWRSGPELRDLQAYQPYYGRLVNVSGSVIEDVDVTSKGEQRLRLRAVRLDGEPMAGQVWVSSAAKADIKRSEVATFHGRLQQGFGNMAASLPRAELVGLAPPAIPDHARQIRDRFAAGVRRAIPEPQASLGSGYLLGQRSTLPEKLDEDLQTAGLTHAVVASGYNLTILVGFARRSLLRHSKYLAALAAWCMIAGFMLVTGLSPSMTRAGLVTGLSLSAWYYGRTIHPFVLLPFAAAITLVISPSYAWGDLGWYLSFASFTGLVVIAPLVKRYFWPLGIKDNGLRSVLLETGSAQLATLPLMLYSFGLLSPYALLANLLVLPLVPLAMLLTFLSGIAGVAVPALASWVGLPASAILHYMVLAVEWVARLPGARLEYSFSLFALCLSYGGLALLMLRLWRITRHRFRNDNMTLIGDKL